MRTITQPLEIRKDEDGNPTAFVGTAIVFGQRSQNLGGFVEVIDRDAMEGADTSDVLGLFNHDNNIILGRSSAGTVKLIANESGVSYEIPYDQEDDDHRRVMRKIIKGEVKGSSFAFRIAANGDRWDEEADGVYVRTVTKFAGIYDVSPVARPAYLQTTAAKRSLDSFKEEKQKEEESKLAEQQREQQEQEKANNQIKINNRKRQLQILKFKHK